jgi:ferredoxin-NADP reductase
LPICIGEPSRHAISRPVLVDGVTRLSEGVVKLRLVSPDGRQMPEWTPGSHIDVECGTPDLTRQYSLCGDPADANALEIAVLHETEGRGGSIWIHDHVPPATGSRSAGRAIISISTNPSTR